MDKHSKRVYRNNVAIVVLNSAGMMLACHRNDRSGVWQIPQGGIDPGEETIEAMYRELREEIGTAEVSILGILPESIKYDWPKELYSRGYHGQEQTYFLVRLHDRAIINLSATATAPEFDKVEWVSAEEFISRLSGFKRDVYTLALSLLDETFPGYFLR